MTRKCRADEHHVLVFCATFAFSRETFSVKNVASSFNITGNYGLTRQWEKKYRDTCLKLNLLSCEIVAHSTIRLMTAFCVNKNNIYRIEFITPTA